MIFKKARATPSPPTTRHISMKFRKEMVGKANLTMKQMTKAEPTKRDCLKVSGPTIFDSYSINCGTVNLIKISNTKLQISNECQMAKNLIARSFLGAISD